MQQCVKEGVCKGVCEGVEEDKTLIQVVTLRESYILPLKQQEIREQEGLANLTRGTGLNAPA